MKKLLTIATLAVFFLANVKIAFAIVEPRDSDNNRFGIHITDENDLDLASELVNSSGGEWGYITIVIREDDRKIEKWQTAFNKMRDLKLIPLVRLATRMENEGWAKPRQEDIDSWVSFLNNLNWVIKNRYIILFNEPNHAEEWGGEVNPQEYAEILKLFYEKLKKASEDFFILPAGFDASAPNTKTSRDMYSYIDEMHHHDPKLFELLDGWSSHSYPNPNFSGLPQHSGRSSIRGYEWELSYLTPLGLKENIPVFITETGWKHKEGVDEENSAYSAETIAKFYREAFEKVWTDNQIIAVSPFILRYPQKPFDNFSWVKFESDATYPQYQTVQDLTKVQGVPVQEHKSNIMSDKLHESLVVGSQYSFKLTVKNLGQSIWNKEEVKVKILSTFPEGMISASEIPETKPFETKQLKVKLQTPKEPKRHTIMMFLEHRGKRFGDIQINNFELIPPPSLEIKANLWIKSDTSAADFKLLIYDYEDLVKEIYPFSIKNGIGIVKELHDIIPQKSYRFVLAKKYYLPRQETAHLKKDKTIITFKRLLPLDFDADGALTKSDAFFALRHPFKTLKLLSPFGN
jgi:hypothetical protein